MGGIYEGCRIVRGTEREPSRENRKDFGSVTSIFSGRVISHLSFCLPISSTIAQITQRLSGALHQRAKPVNAPI